MASSFGGEESTKIVLAYLDKWPELPTLTLAKKIFNENAELFKDVESVRGKLRYYRGNAGTKDRANLKNKQHMTKPGEKAIRAGIPNPYGLPESEEEIWFPFQMPKGNNNVLVLSDIHLPYHNMGAINAAIDYGKSVKPNAIYLNGDVLDFYALSRYEKDPKKRSFAGELEDGRLFLGRLQDIFQCPIYFKIGNHEARYESYLRIKAPELLDVSDFKLETLLKFGQYGVNIIESKQLAYLGKLAVLHGHEFGRSVFSPVNPARGYYNRAKKAMIAGHNHQTSEHSEKALNDDVVTVWSTGCLCELHPQYMPFNKWNHGFAHVRFDKSGDYEVKNLRIIDGKIR